MGCAEGRPESKKQSLIASKNSSKHQFEVYAAFKQNNIDKIKLLMQTSFDIKYKMPSFMGRTVLHLAAEFSDKSFIAFLINSGAEVNALDNSGCPPIYLAMRCGKLDVVSAILEISSHVNINIVTNHNLSFHDFINKSQYKESLNLLKKINYSKLNLVNTNNL
jgi:ankyrin repeat protein